MAGRNNPYKVLGVSETATDAEIKEQFRRLVKVSHPDKNDGDAASNARMVEINAAYGELRDPEKRAAVDEELRQERRAAFEAWLRRERAKRVVAHNSTRTPRRAETPSGGRAAAHSIEKAAPSAVQGQGSGSGWGAFFAAAAVGAAAVYVGTRIADGLGTHYDPSVDRYRGLDGRFRRK